MTEKIVVILSGEIATGKSYLARGLSTKYGFVHLKTRELIIKEWGWDKEIQNTRKELQLAGNSLDETSGGKWLLQYIPDDYCVIDAARKLSQIEAIRQGVDPMTRVVHIHLKSSPEALRERFNRRPNEHISYDEAKAEATEQRVVELSSAADIVIDTSRCRPEDTLARAVAALGIRSHIWRNTDVIVGAQFGSEGKGHVVSHIAQDYDILMRVGGPNAGHTVLRPDTGEPVSFYHLPSGSLHAPDAMMFIGAGAVINVSILEKEANILGGLSSLRGRLWIDPQANIITTEDVVDESALVKGIGSTGQGVGWATARKIVQRSTNRVLARDVEALRPFIGDTVDLLEDAAQCGERVLLEGTQGTLLSLHHGYYPYVTSRDTTVSGTAGEAGIPPGRINRTFLVTRTNPIRVQSPADGTSGPMGIELSWEDVEKRAGIAADVLRVREKTTTTKRLRRVAEFNWVDFRKSCLLNAPTDIALTFVDYIDPRNSDARRFDQLTEETQRFISELETMSRAPVSLITTRFHKRSIIDRRA